MCCACTGWRRILGYPHIIFTTHPCPPPHPPFPLAAPVPDNSMHPLHIPGILVRTKLVSKEAYKFRHATGVLYLVPHPVHEKAKSTV